MRTDFEPVMEALFGHMQNAMGGRFKTMGRRLKAWSDVAAQPALFLRRLGTSDEAQGSFLMTILECELWIYSRAGQDPDAVPDADLSRLDRMAREAFAPDDGEGQYFTLGGLVYWCRIEGRSDYYPGDIGGQGISRIPVRITLP